MDVIIDGVKYIPSEKTALRPQEGDFVEVLSTDRPTYDIEAAVGECGKVVGYSELWPGYLIVELPAIPTPHGHHNWHFHPDDLVVIP